MKNPIWRIRRRKTFKIFPLTDGCKWSVKFHHRKADKNESKSRNETCLNSSFHPHSKHIWQKYVPQCESSGMHLFYLDDKAAQSSLLLLNKLIGLNLFEPTFLCPRIFKSCFLAQEDTDHHIFYSKQTSHATSQ